MKTLIEKTATNPVIGILINIVKSRNALRPQKCRKLLPVAQHQNRYRSPLISIAPENFSNSWLKKSKPLFVAQPHQMSSVTYSKILAQNLNALNRVFNLSAVGKREQTLQFIRPFSTSKIAIGYLLRRLNLSYFSLLIISETQTSFSYKYTLRPDVDVNYRLLSMELITVTNRGNRNSL